MSPPRITASGLRRTELCPASATLPRWRTHHADAEAGTAAHAVLEVEAGESGEIAMAYDVATGLARLLPKAGHREYAVAPTEIPGTADVVEVLPDAVRITDHKTGFGYLVEPASTNIQLHFYALCASLIYGKSAAHVQITNADGVVTSSKDLDAFDLAGIAARVRAIWHAAQGDTRPVVNDLCWRCECIRACPPHREVLVALGSGAAPGLLPAELTPHLVGETWALRNMAYRMLKLYDLAVEAVVSISGPIPLADGRELRLVDSSRESLDGAVTYDVLRTQHGEGLASRAVEMTTTKAAIERAISTVAPKGGKAGMVRAALEAIREAGGAQSRPGKPSLKAVNCVPGALPEGANEEAA